MKVREIIYMLTADGWYLARTKGSHRQYKHPAKKGKVTVAGKPSADLHPDTVQSILTQAGLR
ncbi:MAG TPA: type II toxin-antitoxin system HicA family toxin [Longimicrobium sp.]|nr:type II toxin-antitoxin system HicA family toxin [Longimicrobium sp.]